MHYSSGKNKDEGKALMQNICFTRYKLNGAGLVGGV